MNTRPSPLQDLAHTVSNVLNPFVIFTGLYALVAFGETGLSGAALYLGLELLAAGLLAGYVFSLMRRSRVGDFWISRRAERFFPALVLLAAFVGLLIALSISNAPEDLYAATLSMGLAAGAVAGITLFWKASAHLAVAGHAAMAGPLLLGVPGAAFVLALPLVFWARVYVGAHTPLQTAAGAVVGAAFALLFLA
jgi:membrane-associated phospholipid phosphatase